MTAICATADGAWTLWALGFERCEYMRGNGCGGLCCRVDGLLSFLFFVLKANDAREDETERARDRISYAGWGALS